MGISKEGRYYLGLQNEQNEYNDSNKYKNSGSIDLKETNVKRNIPSLYNEQNSTLMHIHAQEIVLKIDT